MNLIYLVHFNYLKMPFLNYTYFYFFIYDLYIQHLLFLVGLNNLIILGADIHMLSVIYFFVMFDQVFVNFIVIVKNMNKKCVVVILGLFHRYMGSFLVQNIYKSDIYIYMIIQNHNYIANIYVNLKILMPKNTYHKSNQIFFHFAMVFSVISFLKSTKFI